MEGNHSHETEARDLLTLTCFNFHHSHHNNVRQGTIALDATFRTMRWEVRQFAYLRATSETKALLAHNMFVRSDGTPP